MDITGSNERWENWLQFTQSRLVPKFTEVNNINIIIIIIIIISVVILTIFKHNCHHYERKSL